MRELHLFAGAGGGILGGMLLGHTTVCAVEIEPYCRRVLLQRQRDGILPKFPIWDDVTTFDGKPWRGKVDVVCGGFPCTDISVAGSGNGVDASQSGLYKEMLRIVREVGCRFVFMENSPAITFRGLGAVLRDLASMGYDAQWGVLGADSFGADHHRSRWWLVADSNLCRQQECGRKAKPIRLEQTRTGNYRKEVKRPLLGMDDGMAHWVDRLKAIGNGQVPIVAATAFNMLKP